MVSWLVPSTPERAVQVRALAGQDTLFSQCLSPPRCINGYRQAHGTGECNAGGDPAMDKHPIQGGVEIFLVASCYRNWDKLRPDGPLGSYAELLL